MTIRPAAWCERAAQLLAAAVRHVENIERQVQSGNASLFWLDDSTGPVGAFVLRVDRPASGPEGVIVAAAGRVPGVDLTAAVLPYVESLFRDCVRVRIHTARPGLGAKLAAMGYGLQEAVYSKEIQHEPA